ncbi:NAD-dependent epimerase/dehydratase family protein [Beduinella massiliensis]|uniref:NAD-dependent epimerase/dehydratase family protein n=1 Tax=Beduinella massiliensis TaxID=1852363 RepID=UPI000C83CAA6
MKALFIGGTGTISTEVSRLAVERGWELTLLNRGNHVLPKGARSLVLDISDEQAVKKALAGERFDVVADFIVFDEEQTRRDIRLFSGMTNQYFFISSASAYQKPPRDYVITESTPLCNPYWEYSRKKAACENVLMEAYRAEGFPVTVIRPSHTYCERSITVPVHGEKGSYPVLRRMLAGKPVIVPGDGTSLWTLTHASDFAKAFVGLMGHHKAIGEAFTITSDEQLTWNQILQCTARTMGVKANLYHVASDFLIACRPDLEGPLLGDKANSVVFDCSKLKRLVPDFICTTPFDIGVEKAWNYIQTHPECQVEDPAFDSWCDRVIEAQEAGKRAFLQEA